MNRSGRKDSGSSYISGFLVIALNDISKLMSQVRISDKREGRVHTIRLPWQENPWEYDIQDTGHFGLTYGESLWEMNQQLLQNRSRGAFLRWAEGSTYNTFLATENDTRMKSDVPV